ncbi:MAG: hypothetical protein DRQ62_15015, partial [Gammaproteobacteria bacterium]
MQVIKTRYYSPDTAKKRLFYWLLIFFVAISLPVYFLLHKVYSQLQDEVWYRQRNQAELLVQDIERQLLDKLQPEQDRSIAEYSFFNVLESQLLQSTSLNFSPLSELPPKSDIPGLIGYFQIDPDRTFHIPALPELQADLQSGLSSEALAERLTLKEKLYRLLTSNEAKITAYDKKAGLKQSRKDNDTTSAPVVQTDQFNDFIQPLEQDESFTVGHIADKIQVEKKSNNAKLKKEIQQLSEEKLQQLNIETSLWKQSIEQEPPSFSSYAQRQYKRDYQLRSRTEKVQIPDQGNANEILKRNKVAQIAPEATVQESEIQLAHAEKNTAQVEPQKAFNNKLNIQQQMAIRILSFESEVSPLQLISLGSQHLCFYRNAWNDKDRYIQGLIVDIRFLQEIIQPIFNHSNSMSLSSLIIVDKGHVLQHFKAGTTTGELLIFRRALLAPFQEMEIIVNSSHLSASSGKQVLDM